jgi:hypothetical protein
LAAKLYSQVAASASEGVNHDLKAARTAMPSLPRRPLIRTFLLACHAAAILSPATSTASKVGLVSLVAVRGT